LYYITALTALFESVAMIVDQHQPVVEKYYGSGKMSSVIERLLEECDRVVKKYMDGWEEDRSMKRKVNFGHLRYAIGLLKVAVKSLQTYRVRRFQTLLQQFDGKFPKSMLLTMILSIHVRSTRSYRSLLG
jgi:hypothetical protein